MGFLGWLRGAGQDGSGQTLAAAGLGELEAILSPAKRQQIENLQTLEMLRDDEAEGAPPRAVDLDGGTAVIRVRKELTPPVSPPPV